jgi:hypothetical protein
VSEIPWWGLPLVAAVSALLGAAVAQLVTAHNAYARRQEARNRRWYAEREDAYVGLLVAYERTVSRLRAGFSAGVTEPDPLRYLDETGPALMRVRLLASAPVRNAALGIHKLLESLHGERPPLLPGQEPHQHFLERLGHVPLVMHEFEVAVRQELDIHATPPPPPPVVAPGWRQRTRTLISGGVTSADR